MNDFVCSCCAKQKAELIPRKSALVSTQNLLMCPTCEEGRHEPRWLIIISARSIGISPKVTKLISGQRYCGNVIEAAELV